MDTDNEQFAVEDDIIKKAFRNLDKTFDQTREYRQEIVDKLRGTLDSFIPSASDNASLLASKASAISSYVGILNDIDKQAKSKIDVLLKNKEQEDNLEVTKDIVTAFFASGKTLNTNRPLPYEEGVHVLKDADELLDKMGDDGVLIVTEEQLRTDPTDLS